MLNRTNVLRAIGGGLSLWAASAAALGQNVQTLPPGSDAVAGTTANYIPLGASTGGRHQTLFGADQLTGIPIGSVITGLQLRQRNLESTPWPSAAANLPDFEIWLSESNKTPATMTTTFADNVENSVRVRDGALAIAANSYPGGAATGSTPEGWGPVLAFQTNYVYKGGALAVEFRNTGGGAPIHFADCTTNNAGSAGLGHTPEPDGATGSLIVAVIVRLTFTPPTVDLAQGVTKVIVGDGFAGVSGGTGDGVLAWFSQFTQQQVAAANQFDTIGPGSDFVGMAWRIGSSEVAAWPPAIANFSQYDIQLSRSNNVPSALAMNVASNVGADAVQVRTGALSFGVGTFAVRGSQAVAPFGPEVGFTNAYHYRGGPLLSVIRHSGQGSGASGQFDGIGAFSSGLGYNTDVKGFQAGSAAATTTGGTSSYLITRFSVDAGTSSPLNQLSPGSGNVGALTPQLQTILSASELKYVPVGSVIDSLWLRTNSDSIALPATDMFATDLEVSLSSATSQPSGMSTTFVSNEGADKVLVRDGAFALAAGSLPAGSDGHFGKLVQFQKHFVYKGGPLCVTIRHTGLTGGNINTIEGLFGTAAINRTVFSLAIGAPTGSFFGGTYTGTAMKLGYIPSVMTPNSLATTEGQGGWSLPTVPAATVQVIIGASQLRSVDVGSAITGLSFRHSSTGAPSSFPDTDRTLTRFDVTIAPAAHGPLSASSTFANNNGPGVVAVRSGPLAVPKNAFPYSGSASVPGDNAWYVQFDRAYVYTGGDLCVTMRSEGLFTSGSQTFDGDGPDPLASGSAVYSYTSANEVVGLLYGPIGLRLAFTARAFCPWDLNNDGIVEDADFTIFLNAYNILDCTDGPMPQGCPADFNYDRVVDDVDFGLFLPAYNTLLCP